MPSGTSNSSRFRGQNRENRHFVSYTGLNTCTCSTRHKIKNDKPVQFKAFAEYLYVGCYFYSNSRSNTRRRGLVRSRGACRGMCDDTPEKLKTIANALFQGWLPVFPYAEGATPTFSTAESGSMFVRVLGLHLGGWRFGAIALNISLIQFFPSCIFFGRAQVREGGCTVYQST